MCKVCNDDRCIGFYTYRPKELLKRYKHIKEELIKNKNKMFLFINGDKVNTYELHVIENVSKKEQGKLIDRRCLSSSESISDISHVVNLPDMEIDTDTMSYLYSINEVSKLLKSGNLG